MNEDNQELEQIEKTDSIDESFEVLEIVLPVRSEGIEIKFPIYPLQEKDYRDIEILIKSQGKKEIEQVEGLMKFVIKRLMNDCLNHFALFRFTFDSKAEKLIQDFKTHHHNVFDSDASIQAFQEICYLSPTEIEQISTYLMSYGTEKQLKLNELKEKHSAESKALEMEKLESSKKLIKRADLNVQQANELAEMESKLKVKYFEKD